MRILDCQPLALPEVVLVAFARFCDQRGYFTESYRASDFPNLPGLPAATQSPFVQANESYSHRGAVRGLHLQFQPHQGKLVRAVFGHIIDLAADVRGGSPTFGKIIACELTADPAGKDDRWLWIPPGFAHGFVCVQDSLVQYLCTGEYNPAGEVSISPLAPDLDWSLCELRLAKAVRDALTTSPLLSDKDRAGLTLTQWAVDPRIAHFPAP